MYYKVSYENPHRHFIKVTQKISITNDNPIVLQLPSWRPGRYELGNFAKNIRDFRVSNEENRPVNFIKISKDSWRIESKNSKEIEVEYLYYANELNAGSTYLDEHQLYVNPINCCCYVVGREMEPGTLEIKVPENYQIAVALPAISKNSFSISNFDELVESPFIASPTLTKWTYQVEDYNFYIWFQGLVTGNEEKVVKDFEKFTRHQIQAFKSLPTKEYHFLYQLSPFKSYHGVEHTASTVITLGPDKEVFQDKLYEEFIGVSSHELYHAWNIKALRPASMKPYAYAKENYSKLGYIYEGLTTYMGDLCLWESGVYTNRHFQHSFEVWLEKHFYNSGRKHYSIAASSYDTWLDGYVLGIPGRKVSIYQDGALCMFMIDCIIRERSDNTNSLQDIMTEMYSSKDIRENGYSEAYIMDIFVKYGGIEVKEIFDKHIYGTEDYLHNLKKAFKRQGWQLDILDNTNSLEAQLGVQIISKEGSAYIYRVEIDSIADKNGIAVGDFIEELNGDKIDFNKPDMLEGIQQFDLKIKRKFDRLELKLTNQEKLYFPKFKVTIP